MNLATSKDGSETVPDSLRASNKDTFDAKFTTPTSDFNSDGFFGTATPGSFVPYMNLN